MCCTPRIKGPEAFLVVALAFAVVALIRPSAWKLGLIVSSKEEVPMQASLLSLGAKPPLTSPQIRVKSLHTPTTFNDPTDSTSMAAVPAPKWAQKTITLPPQRRGCHLITPKILKEIGQDLSGFKCGLAHLFVQHTSASLTINENYDSDVRDDTETFLSKIVPEGRSAPWKHTLEGPDDMPAHIKSSMFGCSLTIPITDGQLNMGTWQDILNTWPTCMNAPLLGWVYLHVEGIWLCEHRDRATARKVVVTLNGV